MAAQARTLMTRLVALNDAVWPLMGRFDDHYPTTRWSEPEPQRWIGATGIYRAYSWADELEKRSTAAKTSVVARIADKAAQP